MRQKRVGVLLGGRSSEREISLRSGNAVREALIRKGYRTVAMDPGEGLVEKLKDERIDVAFIALHGKWGEDGTIQGLLEMMGIPYTGSGVLGSASAMDKITMKLILAGMGIATPIGPRPCRGEPIDFPAPLCGEACKRGLDHRHLRGQAPG